MKINPTPSNAPAAKRASARVSPVRLSRTAIASQPTPAAARPPATSGSYGAGLHEFLLAEGIAVVEVERPRREDRRRGKSDAIDALAAAKKVLAGDGLSTPRAGGARQALSALLVAYRSCVGERTRVLNQLQALHTSAPLALRERIGAGNGKQLAARLIRMRSRASAPEAEQLIFTVLRDLARRATDLKAHARDYEHELTDLIDSLDPTLLDERGIGPISTAKLLAADPGRLKSEAAFARCNGTAPKPASSGQTIRHRLDRGGDRQANNAIHTIAIIRCVHDPQTRAYLERRTRERQDQTPSHARPQTTPLPQPLQTPHHHPLDVIEASPSRAKRQRLAGQTSGLGSNSLRVVTLALV